MEKQGNGDIWNIKFDPKRKVIIYDYQKDVIGKDDAALEELYKNIVEITANMNIPAEVDLHNVKVQITPGMTLEQVLDTCKTASESQKEKEENKKEFMREHQNRLEQNKKMTNQIRLGVLTPELQNPVEIDGYHKGIDTNVVSSHAFQSYVKKNKEEFSSILENLKKSARIVALKNRIEQENSAEFSLYIRSVEDYIADDKGKDYASVQPETLGAVCDEFYRRHKDEIESILGEKNYAFLKRLERENDIVASVTISKTMRGSDCGASKITYVDAEEYSGKQHRLSFESELCTSPVKEGDGVLFTMKKVKDPEYGTLVKKDAYAYKDGKYAHIYQSYSSLSDVRTDTIRLTKSMQQKSQEAAQHNTTGRVI